MCYFFFYINTQGWPEQICMYLHFSISESERQGELNRKNKTHTCVCVCLQNFILLSLLKIKFFEESGTYL